MSWRTNLKLLVAAVALTVYYRAYEAGLPSWQQKGRVFPGLEPSRIVELDLSWPQTAEDASLGVDARSVSLRYESFEGSERQWWIVEPFRFRALHPRVQGLVYSVADMVRVAQVEGEDEFFESKPTVRVRFALDDGSEHVVEIGSDYPDASLKFCYARVDDTVFWTKQDLKSSFAVALEQLRGRALFPVPPQEVVSLSVDGAERVAKMIERKPGGPEWRMLTPVASLADREITETVLADLNSWGVVDFEADDASTPEGLRAYGLDSPRATVTLKRREGAAVSIDIGAKFKRGDESLVYVRHTGQPFVFTAEANVANEVMGDPGLFRNRYVFDLQTLEVSHLDIDVLRGEGVGQKLSVRKLEVTREERGGGERETQDEFVWQVEDVQSGETFEGDQRLIQNLLSDLRRLRIEKFVDEVLPEAGLDPARGKLTLHLSGDQKAELFFGARSTDEQDRAFQVYYVRRSGETGAYLVLTPIPLLFDSSGHGLRKRNISDVEPTQLAGITLKHSGRSWNLMRSPGNKEWVLPVGHEVDGTIDSDLIDQLALAFHSEAFRVRRYFPELRRDAEVHGFAQRGVPWRVELRFADRNTHFRRLDIGKLVEGSDPAEYYAQASDLDIPIFSVNDEIPSLVKRLQLHLEAIVRPGSAKQEVEK